MSVVGRGNVASPNITSGYVDTPCIPFAHSCAPLLTSPSKSVTMDSWTREQINTVRNIGNARSNAIYNPNEGLHPPPTATGSEDRDSEIEKYIRRKYEQGAFKAGASGSRLAPTSLNRAREADGRIPSGAVLAERRPFPPGRNNSNPELNDVLVVTSPASVKDRDLPALPAARGDAMPRPRPSRSPSATERPATAPGVRTLKQNPFGLTPSSSATSMQLIDFEGGSSATRPLQVNSFGGDQGAINGQFGTGNPFGQQQMAQSNIPVGNQPTGQANGFSNGLHPHNPFYHSGQFDPSSQSFHSPAPSPFHQPQQPLQQQHTMPPFQHQPSSFPPPNAQSGFMPMHGQSSGLNGQSYVMNGFATGMNGYNAGNLSGYRSSGSLNGYNTGGMNGYNMGGINGNSMNPMGAMNQQPTGYPGMNGMNGMNGMTGMHGGVYGGQQLGFNGWTGGQNGHGYSNGMG